MDQVGSLSINSLPLESKTLEQAKEELLREITIPAAIQVSLYMFAASYSSILLPPLFSLRGRRASFCKVIYTLACLAIGWREGIAFLFGMIYVFLQHSEG